ncbi:MAG: c-type cytochrome [Kiloniellales bacterium]
MLQREMHVRHGGVWLGAIAVSLAVGALAAYSLWPQDAGGNADPDNRAQVALGRQVYMEACASCHGENLEGQPDWRVRLENGRLPAPPHDATGHTWHHPDELLFGMTKIGIAAVAGLEGYETDMPAFEGVLPDAEIWAVLAYIKSTWPPAVSARQANMNQQYQQN